ncbi:ECF transporter S component [Limosilactobacillus reuteri]|uniref:ECF transporter S component n=1 Tax=Limosilactobacillus reuteri TaxID=1598 RepID=UPI000C1B70D8|nr:ECF transporter S component [Limosilactobacillus reuteri]MDW5473916.1 ECF transporter S component [Limosilactobacillus reuteri]PIN29517.1 ECF transporter S component [Limosilactobacillus reuteri]PUH32850.1 ECF transporter S component [Limosilactobacillus reuteri]PUH33105.1 ECF transporter S component [Limosilactobacillus reuteri]WLC95629.1 ECF transporter S component [Limosilactobacillus reuteri]
MKSRAQIISKHDQVKRMILIAMLAALGTILRVFKIIPIPNVQPVTDLIMIATLMLGIGFGISLAVMIMVLSNLLLGFGIWTIPQILAYAVCVITVAGLAKVTPLKKHFTLQLILATFLGFEYGFIVSLGMSIYGGWAAFMAYWLSGLLFDFYHVVGNFGCYFILYKPLTVAFKHYL